jgi:hypothetical protein
MAYYSSVGSSNYSVSTPVIRYSLGDGALSYSVTLDDLQPAYQGTGNYALPVPISEPKLPEYNSLRASAPKRAEVVDPIRFQNAFQPETFDPMRFQRGFSRPIDQLINDFLPQKHLNPAIDEIERALSNVVKIEQFEVEEEIIIRRRVRKTSVTAGKKAIFDPKGSF